MIDFRQCVQVDLTLEEHYRLGKLESECGIPGFNFDEAKWMEGCREILGDRCPTPYTVGVLRHIPPTPAPVCGEDFCEVCGDCMACNGDFLCFDGAPHVWRV